MTVTWLIEDFEKRARELIEEVRRQGGNVVEVSYIPHLEDNIARVLNRLPSAPCLASTSINVGKRIQEVAKDLSKKLVPGVWCSWEDYDCTAYYSHLGEYILNQNYIMLPLAEMIRRRKELLDHFNGSFFVRPNSVAKTFSGMVLTAHDFEMGTSRDFNSIQYLLSNAKGSDLVVVAPYRKLKAEWRLWCRRHEDPEQRVITASMYHLGDELKMQRGAPQEVIQFAAHLIEILKEDVFDPIFVLDFAETKDGDIKLMEPGSFTMAGYYDIDFEPLVRVANEIAEEMFQKATSEEVV